MKILQLCLRIPFPPSDGGNIAMLRSAEGLLSAGNEVHIAAVNTAKHFTSLENATSGLKQFNSFTFLDIDTEVKLIPALLNIFGKGSYNIQRFYSVEFEILLIKLLKENNFDVIQIESIFMLPYLSAIRKHSKARIALRAHNVEHIIWEQLAQNETRFLRSVYLKFLAKRLKQYEMQTLKKVDAIISISPSDADFFKRDFPETKVHISPVSLPVSENIESHEIKRNSIFHLGSMDWLPNVEAILWFLQNVWPIVLQECPDTTLYLAGRKMPESIMAFSSKNVIVEGFVENSKTFMKNHGIMIIPILSGSGIRVKIIEGLSMGIPMVSTSLGAEGIHVNNKEHILIEDDVLGFAKAVISILNDEKKLSSISNSAKELFIKEYSLGSVGKDLSDFYSNLIR